MLRWFQDLMPRNDRWGTRVAPISGASFGMIL